MSYYKPKIGNIIKNILPKEKDRTPTIKLNNIQKEKLKTVGEVVLTILAVGALPLTVAAVEIFNLAENRTIFGKQKSHKEKATKITKVFYYMKKRGYIELKREGDDFQVNISQKGREKIKKMNFEALKIERKKLWDKHWWAVIADVPNDYRWKADYFREKIKELGFYPLQRTVWIFPFDPRDEVDFVAANYGIEHFVTTMRVDTLDPEDEKALKGHFKDKKII